MTERDPPAAVSTSSVVDDSRFGFWAALGTGVFTVVTFGIALATPPLSGPMCARGCFTYPFVEIAARFPRDYYWMFAAS